MRKSSSRADAGVITLLAISQILGILVSSITVVEFVYRTDILKGASPLQKLERNAAMISLPNWERGNDDPGSPEGSQEPGTGISAPVNLQVTGDCATGFTLSWESPPEPVTGYRIVRDGSEQLGEVGSEALSVPLTPEPDPHEYSVVALNPPEESPLAGPVQVTGCPSAAG
ncbi:MAG: fibronectin type III domain-containing protein [Actinomycetota bacterium]|nr:fibronectin type III domain-containing protein [Actinomycetota bacterium]